MGFLCGYRIFNGTMDEAINKIIATREKVHVISGNPEVLYNGFYNELIYDNFTSQNSVIIPDGIGVIKPLRLKGHNIQKIAGIDLFMELLNKLDKDDSVYFLGASDDVLNIFIKNIRERYKNINIAGYHHGYIDIDNCNHIINDIKSKQPTIIFVAMGSPKQELLMEKMYQAHPAIYQGLGGSFDVYTGNVKRAPEWWIKHNLEFAYRLLKQPSRIKRQIHLIKFLILVKTGKI